MRKVLLSVVMCALIVGLTACRKNIVYSHFCPISSEQWHVDSIAQFNYTISDLDASYRILVYVRHTEQYPYQNMWLFVDDDQKRDTIEFYLADDRGQWLGNRHHGFIEMPVLLEETYHYPDTGSYHLSIQQGMRDSILRGITDVGVEVIKIKN